MKEYIQELLNYQKKLIELQNLEGEVIRSQANANLKKWKNALQEAQNQVFRVDKDAMTVSQRYEQIKAELSALEKELDEIQDCTAEIGDLKYCQYIAKKVEQLEVQIDQLFSEIKLVEGKIGICKKDYNDAIKKGVDAKEQRLIAKKEYDEEVSKHQPLADEINKQIKELEQELGKYFIDDHEGKKVSVVVLFKKVREQIRKMPVVVPLMNADKNTGNCGGCGIELSAASITKINDTSIIECANCGRILYKLN